MDTFVSQLLLPPATKLGQGYIFTGVCDSVHGGVLVLGGVPALRGVSAPGGVPLPGGVCFQGGACSGGCLLPGGAAPSLVPGVPAGNPPPRTATAAGSTHPTGMHSCFTK